MLAWYSRTRNILSLPVDTGLNENETELGVLILAVTLKVLADGNSLFIRLAGYSTNEKFLT
jgi:hypothetical protein